MARGNCGGSVSFMSEARDINNGAPKLAMVARNFSMEVIRF